MLTYADAERLAWKHLHETAEVASCGPLTLLHEHTMTKPYGWVFFYQSRVAVETKDKRLRLSGNYPFLVDRFDERVAQLGPEFREDLAEYETGIPSERLAIDGELPPAR